MAQTNPFLIEGYISEEYFCDRQQETALLARHIGNGCNVALIAERRIGKSGLIHNYFHRPQIAGSHYCFYIDIYETKNVSELAYALGKSILTTLKPLGRKVWERFLGVLTSIRSGMTFDINGNPEWSLTLGEIKQPDVVLDEIFAYLANADKPCIVAIDEFQVIADYPEKNVEATLRKHIQNCHNARFIFSGSKRHIMAEIFATSARPFYNSTTIMGLQPIDRVTYMDFANSHLAKCGRSITPEAFDGLYDSFDGITWYIQYILNILYTMPLNSSHITPENVQTAIGNILQQQSFVYSTLLYQLTPRQKQLLRAIAAEGAVSSIMSKRFLQNYSMTSSMVQTAAKILLDRDFITLNDGIYQVYDRFLRLWLLEKDKG